MNTYKIGYHSYEESEYFELQHEKKFTEDEFLNIVADAMKKVMWHKKEEDDLYSCYGDARSFVKYLARGEDNNDSFFKLDDLFSEIKPYLLEAGFVEVKYENEVSFFGWSEVIGSGWKNESGGITNKLIELLKPEAEKALESIKKEIEAEDK
jgi:hypothetical protein